jgi:multidrug efflux pump subunit AcrB
MWTCAHRITVTVWSCRCQSVSPADREYSIGYCTDYGYLSDPTQASFVRNSLRCRGHLCHIRTAENNPGAGGSEYNSVAVEGVVRAGCSQCDQPTESDPADRNVQDWFQGIRCFHSERSPQTIADLNRIPIKTIGGTTIYIKDAAWVRDGFPPQTNIVRVNGQRSVLLTIQKAGNASTLNVIAGIKALLP